MKEVYCQLEKSIDTKISFILKVKVDWFNDILKNWIYRFKVSLIYDIWYMDWIKKYTIKCLSKLDKETNKWIKDEIKNKINWSKILELDDAFLYLNQ